jgi:NAD(P)-dependent dehydrogenase (short-subunit alcohol dehydrogenase family)
VTDRQLLTADDVLDGVELDGKVVVVTGASGGLGREAVRAVSSRGAITVAAMRDPAKSGAGPDPVDGVAHVVPLDLASLASVRAAATAISGRWPHIDVLINNAGVMATLERRTADDFELQLGTNHLGHFLLTARLAPTLGASGRIVNVSSLGHMLTAMRWDDPHYRTRPYEKWEAYGQSKTANILFTVGLAQRGFDAYAVHPGTIATDLDRHLSPDERAFVEEASKDAGPRKTPAQGVATILWAATATGLPPGSYLADCEVAEAAAHATDPADAERLWSWSEDQVHEPFPSRRDRPLG